MKETNLIQSMTNIKKIRLFNNSLLYGNPKVYLDFSRIDFFCFNDTLFLFIPENLCIIKTEYKNKTDLLEDIVNGITPKDIEKCFDDLKNETDMKRLRTQSGETARGKLFVVFIAQIVRAYMLNNLTDYMRKNTYTMKKIFNELDKIKQFDLHRSSTAHLANPLTKKQRELYELLEIPAP